MERELAATTDARDRAISAITKGIISESDLERQLAGIKREVSVLAARIAALRDHETTFERQRALLRTAETMLDDLRTRLDQPLTFDTKRKVVEALVDSAVIATRFQKHAE